MTLKISRRSLLTAAGGLLGATSLDILAAPDTPQRPPPDMLRLIANENPYGPSPTARTAAAQAVADSWKYAMRETAELKKLIAAHEGVPTDHVMVSAGSSEALRVAVMVFGRTGGRIIAATPTFDFLPTYARTIGCTVDKIPLNKNMAHDLDAMTAAIRTDTRLIYVCNPNNPTGTLIEGDKLSAFIDTVTPHAPVLVDEAYLDLWDDLAKHTAVTSILAGRPVIVTRTFSKLHGMAGLRVGYAIAPPKLIKQLENFRVTLMSYPGVMAAMASLQDTEFLTTSRAHIHECLAITSSVLEELGLPYVPSRGNFIYFDTGGSAKKFMRAMMHTGIMTGLSYAPYPSWARVSMGRVEDMQVFADAARGYFGQDS